MLEKQGFTEPTPVQVTATPPPLAAFSLRPPSPTHFNRRRSCRRPPSPCSAATRMLLWTPALAAAKPWRLCCLLWSGCVAWSSRCGATRWACSFPQQASAVAPAGPPASLHAIFVSVTARPRLPAGGSHHCEPYQRAGPPNLRRGAALRSDCGLAAGLVACWRHVSTCPAPVAVTANAIDLALFAIAHRSRLYLAWAT